MSCLSVSSLNIAIGTIKSTKSACLVANKCVRADHCVYVHSCMTVLYCTGA